MADSTPIPAGVLAEARKWLDRLAADEVDIAALRTESTYHKRTPDHWTIDVLDDQGVWASVPAYAALDESARMYADFIAAAPGLIDHLTAPPRPDGVPDDAVPAVLWFGPMDGDGDGMVYGQNGQREDVESWKFKLLGVPVPPYQPTPPEPEPAERCGRTLQFDPDDPIACKCVLDRGHGGGCECDHNVAPPVSEVRTGPLGLIEGDDGSSFNGAIYGTCMANTMTGEPGIFIRYDPARGMLVELESRVRDWFHEEVFERWDAEDAAPAETLADIVAVERDDVAAVVTDQRSGTGTTL